MTCSVSLHSLSVRIIKIAAGAPCLAGPSVDGSPSDRGHATGCHSSRPSNAARQPFWSNAYCTGRSDDCASGVRLASEAIPRASGAGPLPLQSQHRLRMKPVSPHLSGARQSHVARRLGEHVCPPFCPRPLPFQVHGSPPANHGVRDETMAHVRAKYW